MSPDQLLATRKAMQLTQEGLATLLGVARNTIVRYETGLWAIPTAISLAMRALNFERKLLNAVTGGPRRQTPGSEKTHRTRPPSRPPS